jgi:16S rRNA pseudouridine516 synthase
MSLHHQLSTLNSPHRMKLRRIDQLISSLGYATRREVRELVDDGRVSVAGVIAKRSDDRVDPALVTFDDEPLEHIDGLLAIFHKPAGYTCTHSTEEGDTIYTLLPPRWLARNPAVTSIGRLDKDTTGLLLITDNGQLVQRLTSPKHESEKTYEATLAREIDPSMVAALAAGTLILRNETTPCLPAKLEILGPMQARITVVEGRYHQVRRMFAALGNHVEALHRTHFGEYALDDIAEGEWRVVEQEQAT